MPRSYVLVTALPPTKGHTHLIEFASALGETAEVILSTQPSEPFVWERLEAIRKIAARFGNVNVHHIHKELPQEPDVAVGFWDMWLDFLQMHGLTSDDYIVASEMYGAKLAEISGATFMPYDTERQIYWSKATEVRDHPREHFDEIALEFQRQMRMTVTVFGAESTGKTTLSRALASRVNGFWLPEYARPYLETVGIELTTERMMGIWHGQLALQEHVYDWADRPFIVQDTDLFTTAGYWDFWDPGATPDDLLFDAGATQSDIYLVTKSNIPFERDPLRYGGDKREQNDEYWLNVCDRYALPYRVIESDTPAGRLAEAQQIIEEMYDTRFTFSYQRRGQ